MWLTMQNDMSIGHVKLTFTSKFHTNENHPIQKCKSIAHTIPNDMRIVRTIENGVFFTPYRIVSS